MQNFVCQPKPGRSLPGIDQVMRQVNAMADFCHEWGFQVTLLEDATTAFDELIHRISLMNIKLFFGDVRPVVSVMGEIRDSI